MSARFKSAQSQEVSYGDSTLIDGLTQLSGFAWVKLDSLTSAGEIFRKWRVSPSAGFLLFFDDDHSGTANVFKIVISPNASLFAVIITDANTAVVGKWQSVSFGFHFTGNGFLSLFHDGIKSSQSDELSPTFDFIPDFPEHLTVSSTAGNPFDGSIAHCALWNRFLSDGEHTFLHRGGHPLDLPYGRIFYDPLDDPHFRNRVGLHEIGTQANGAIVLNDDPLMKIPSSHRMNPGNSPPTKFRGGAVLREGW